MIASFYKKKTTATAIRTTTVTNVGDKGDQQQQQLFNGVFGGADRWKKLLSWLTTRAGNSKTATTRRFGRVMFVVGPCGCGKTTFAMQGMKNAGLNPILIDACDETSSEIEKLVKRLVEGYGFKNVLHDACRHADKKTCSCNNNNNNSSSCSANNDHQVAIGIVIDNVDVMSASSISRLSAILGTLDASIPVICTCTKMLSGGGGGGSGAKKEFSLWKQCRVMNIMLTQPETSQILAMLIPTTQSLMQVDELKECIVRNGRDVRRIKNELSFVCLKNKLPLSDNVRTFSSHQPQHQHRQHQQHPMLLPIDTTNSFDVCRAAFAAARNRRDIVVALEANVSAHNLVFSNYPNFVKEGVFNGRHEEDDQFCSDTAILSAIADTLSDMDIIADGIYCSTTDSLSSIIDFRSMFKAEMLSFVARGGPHMHRNNPLGPNHPWWKTLSINNNVASASSSSYVMIEQCKHYFPSLQQTSSMINTLRLSPTDLFSSFWCPVMTADNNNNKRKLDDEEEGEEKDGCLSATTEQTTTRTPISSQKTSTISSQKTLTISSQKTATILPTNLPTISSTNLPTTIIPSATVSSIPPAKTKRQQNKKSKTTTSTVALSSTTTTSAGAKISSWFKPSSS